MKTTNRRSWTWTRWAPLLALTAMLAACGGPVTPDPATTEPATTPAPAGQQATCVDSAIRLPGLGPRVHGAIVSDTLHMGGATAPATCMEPANQSLAAGLPPMPAGRTEQAQQSQSRYYLIVIRYPGGNRLYVLSRRPDGTSCVVDTNDRCIARVTDLPDDFDLQDLPEDVAPTIPAGRPAPPTVEPPPGGGDTPPAVEPPPNGYTPPAVSPPPAAGTPPGSAGAPQPSTGAAGVAVSGPLLSWGAASRALSYDVYWGTTKDLAADTERGTPINTSSTFVTIAASASLAHGTLYYWRVDAKNEAGTTRGAVWSFTTAAAPATSPPPAASPPGAAWFPSPASGATNEDVNSVRLLWEPPDSGGRGGARATSYDVYYGTTQNLAADADLGTPIRSTTSFVDLAQRLAYETTYYWRVDAKNAAGATEGPVWSFTTRTAPAPVAPGGGYTPPVVSPPPAEEPPATPDPRLPGAVSIDRPRNGATGLTVDGPKLYWRASPRAISYDLYWGATATDLGTPINTPYTSKRIYAFPSLAHETLYYWRVDAKNDAGTTRGSVWSFTTMNTPAEGLPKIWIFSENVSEGTATRRGFPRPTQHYLTVRITPRDYERPPGQHEYFQYWTVDGEGTAKSDYRLYRHPDPDFRGTSGRSRFPCVSGQGCGFKNIPIYIYSDSRKEENERFYVQIRPVSWQGHVWATCGRCRAPVIIIDDD